MRLLGNRLLLKLLLLGPHEPLLLLLRRLELLLQLRLELLLLDQIWKRLLLSHELIRLHELRILLKLLHQEIGRRRHLHRTKLW